MKDKTKTLLERLPKQTRQRRLDRFGRRVAAFSAGRTDQEHELGGIFGPIIQNTLWHDGDAELGADGARPGAGDPFDCKRCPIQVEPVRTILPACLPVRGAVHGRDFRSVL